MMDLFLYYIDDICDEKITELSHQVKFYGFIACFTTIALIMGGVLALTVYMFHSNEDEDTDINALEHIFTAEVKDDNDYDKNKLNDNNYVAQWELSKKIRDKALFWKNKKNEDIYGNLIDVYAEKEQENGNDNSYGNDNDEKFYSARAVSRSSILKTPVSKYKEKSRDISPLSLASDTQFQNISLMMEDDDDDDDNDGSDYGLNGFASRSEDNLNGDISNSKLHTINMSMIGPGYYYVYIGNIYGNWEEFENRLQNDVKVSLKGVNKAFKILDRKILTDFKKGKNLNSLKMLRCALSDNNFQKIVLEKVINKVDFFKELVLNAGIVDEIRLEIYLIFYYSFCFESDVLITFQFLNVIIRTMVESLSHANGNIFNDGMKILVEIVGYCDIVDFNERIFVDNFMGINFMNDREQKILWEVLKLVIVRWMFENESEIENIKIYDILRVKVEKLIESYVEKDNEKYLEFLLIWDMVKRSGNNDKENSVRIKRRKSKKLI